MLTNRKLSLVLLILAGFLFSSCVPAQRPPPDYSRFIWPPPPNPPKIKFVKLLRSDLDIRKLSHAEKLFGAENTFTFGKPYDITVDKRGVIFITDDQRRSVVTVNIKAQRISKLHNPYGFSWPLGIAYDEANDIIAVADAQKRRVYMFDARTKKLTTVIGDKGEFRNPAGVAFDSKRGRLYVTDSKGHKLMAFDLAGNYIETISTGLYFPTAIEVDRDGNIYVVDSMNFRYVVFAPDGQFLSAFGEHGDQLGMFARPKGLALDSDGHIYVTDAAFANFQIFNKKGQNMFYIGKPGRGVAQFQLPMGIHIDKNDKIYVADSYNRRIQIFQYISEAYKQRQAEGFIAPDPLAPAPAAAPAPAVPVPPAPPAPASAPKKPNKTW